MNRKKTVSVILIFVVFSFVAYKFYNKPHVDVKKTSPNFKINAEKLFSEFSLNETNANEKYLDKIIEVEGEILDIILEDDKGVVSLKTRDDFASVMCYLSENSSKSIQKLSVGNIITLKGICTGYLMDVVLVKSEILN